MSIDEAIAKYNKLANNDRTCRPEEAQQLAEWLEELKAYREIGTVEECKNSILDIQKAYNKAIDDAKSVILQTLDNEILVDTLHLRLEQLKAGDAK